MANLTTNLSFAVKTLLDNMKNEKSYNELLKTYNEYGKISSDLSNHIESMMDIKQKGWTEPTRELICNGKEIE